MRSFVGKHGMQLGAARFVAGETLDECVPVLRRLNEQGLHANTTILGEDVEDEAEARAVADEYEGVLQRLHDEDLRANVALKLTHLGLDLGEKIAYENVHRIVEKAAELGNFVRIDMEYSAVVDQTLSIYRRLRESGLSNVGTVLQSYLYRAEDDSGSGIGMHTSRVGYAESTDGVTFTRRPRPVLFPDDDAQRPTEWQGGCEDPRVVETDDDCEIARNVSVLRNQFGANNYGVVASVGL